MSEPAVPSGGAPVASILDRLRAKREAALPTRIQRASRGGEPSPLSDGQERLWLIDQLLPGNTAYSITAAVSFEGPLDPDLLALALGEIVRRHEALRTTFRAAGDSPVQVVAPASAAAFPVRILDLAGLAAPDREIERLARQEAEIPFDLTRGPLLRATLLRLGPENHMLLVALHHIVSDGWSIRILLRETRILYQAYHERHASPLPELPIQYVDFVEWQRRWLASAAAGRQLAYWKQQIGEHPATLQLPGDRPRPAVQTLRGAAQRFALRRGAGEEIERLSRGGGTTAFVTLLSAFQALLHRLSDQPEVLVGFPIANRKRVEIQDLIGFFAGTLVLRAEITVATRFSDLLLSMHAAALGAFEHQELPFGRLVKELQPERQLSRSPLFQAAFVYQNLEAPDWSLPGLRLTPRDFERGTAMFDLSLVLRQGAEGLEGAVEYSTDLFDASTAARLAEHFQVLLEGAIADPEQRIEDLPLLSPAGRHQLLMEHNDTAAPVSDRCLHELFEAQAARIPEAVALVFAEASLSYGELERRANRLARWLRVHAVGPEVRVGICLERSLEMIVALLAVQKAGGAYVPLDPGLPVERLRFLVEDSAAGLVISESRFRELLPESRLCLLDQSPEGLAAQEEAPLGRLGPDSPAYVIYTSGTTGRPKGVVVPHRGVVNHMQWIGQVLPLEPGDRLLHKTPFFFDASAWEIYAPLFSGATLVIARPGGHQDPAYLVEAMERHEVTAFQGVPTLLSMLSEEPGLERCRSLRWLFSGGEALSCDLAERLSRRLDVGLYNLYGPTEASIDATGGPVVLEAVRDAMRTAGRTMVLLGRPLPSTQVHLLDRRFQLVPLGVPGQLCIGGVQVARGYLNRPALTAERFLPDPYGDGTRLYATGDLARRLPSGEIDYLGRIDHQVKVRGFRIELGEIETVLSGHAGVRDAVVVARSEQGTGGARLVAYVVLAAESAAETDGDLREICRERLPDYMVPSAFVILESLPLTPNGKVDRRALPAPESAATSLRKLVPPRTPAEEIVAAIWAAVLGIERIGVHDNFFELGGHSLLANQVVLRVRDAFRRELPLRSFFAAPTVEALAELLERGGEDSIQRLAPPLTAHPRQGGEPLSFAQQRLWFLHQLDPESTAYHIPVALHLEGDLDPAALENALDGVIRRHETLRTTFELRADGPVQAVAPPAHRDLPLVDLSGLHPAQADSERRRWSVLETLHPFDLALGPLLRTLLVRLGPNEHVLLVVMHHIVSDAWSMTVLWRETIALYRGLELPELPVQYSDFARWQREWLRGEVLEEQLSYWRRQLTGAPTLLELPIDRQRPPVQRFRGSRQEFSLSGEAARQLKDIGRREGATLFMTVLAAFNALLHRYSRQDDVVVGFPIAGRNRLEVEGLIGFFVNTLALRAAVSGASSWRELLRQVREVSLAGYAHQDLPFEKLVAELGIERNLAHAPLFQTLLVMQNTPPLAVELPELTVQPLELGTGTAKFDLVLNLGETADGLSGRWLYNSELFEAPTVARMARHFEALLEGILADPRQRIEDLPLLGTAERQQLVLGWNDTALDSPSGSSFHGLFEAQVELSSSALAVAEGPREISYGELNARANRLARGLLAAGVGSAVRSEEIVAVLAERGADLLTAMLAVFKAGGVYLPLDPHHPAQRLLHTIEQSDSRFVLVSDALRGEADVLAADGRTVLALDELLREERSAENLSRRSVPAQLAYVLFTSGSTGVPKGVMIPQQGMINHLSAKISDLGLTAGDRVAQTALQTFDISIWQFLAALLVGGSVHVLSDEIVHDPLRLLDEIEARGITVFETVPSLLNVLLQVDARFRPALACLRWLIPTGEALPPELCRQWLDAYPEIPLVNAYGPTECSDDVTHQILRRPPAEGMARTPIGSPVLNTRVYVLEPAGDPAPIGVPGELAVGGVQVGRGYWGRPDLSAERFVPDPFGPAGGRLYRTGDLARRRAGGEVEFLGRIDHQVKVRGFRIELGDIEAALLSHPAVRDAVVLAREAGREGGLDKRLVAYVVTEDGEEISDLRAFLQKSLPEYMVPAAVVQLDRMPLTANGKVDRKALPAPEDGGGAGAQEFVAPRTDLERSLAGMWAEVLGLQTEQVGVQDSFFDIGGDSIRGAVLINRLQKKLGQIVHVVALFDHPTVAEIAAYLLRDYPEAVARIWGLDVERGSAPTGRIGTAQVALLREIIPPLSPAAVPEVKNPPAVFLLSAPRSGSTLLRVLLGGSPSLFAPPELELLSFTDMAERRAAFSGRNAFWREGLLRAVMEVLRCGPEEARDLVESWEAEGLPTRLVYRRLQEWLGGRILVDKTPSYALSPGALRRAETDFEGARYIHLMRHPGAAIHSFEEARLDQVFFRHPHPFTRRELAELIWGVSHQNIVEFLAEVPAERQHWVHFEDLVRDPVAELTRLCGFLGIDFHPDMTEPYKEAGARMTDGLHAQSRMLGDVKFHQHAGIEAGAAERWRREPGAVESSELGEPTHQTAALLGYDTRPEETPDAAAPLAAPPLLRRPGRDAELLSFAQQRLWFFHQLDPESGAYHLPNALRIEGALDPAVLESALEGVVRRHETLRTSFGVEGGEPVQIVAPPTRRELPVVDLSGLGAARSEAEMLARVRQEGRRPFDLAHGPLLRTLLIRLGPREHALLVVMHHIVSDAWSMAILWREILTLYRARLERRSAELPELPVQYSDFAVWQRGWLTGEVLAAQLSYWRRQLAGAPALLDMPTDRQRPAVQTFSGANEPVRLEPEVLAGLRALAREQGATLFMTLLAAFAALLQRYSRQDDFVVGTPVAGRTRIEVEDLIGFFVNMLVLRADLGGEPRLSELLGRIRATALAAYAHQELPFEKLVMELQPERDFSRAPLFQVVFTLQNAPGGELSVPGLAFRPLSMESRTAKLDLTLALAESGSGLAGVFEYNRDLFDGSTVRRLAQHLSVLLAAFSSAFEGRVSELPLLTAAEGQELLLEWNDTAKTCPQQPLVHELFSEHARRRPEATAISSPQGRLSYGEVEALSNRLAHHLRSSGVGPEVLVAVCMERTLERVVGIVAVLKAGGAYVSLDPTYPRDRLSFLLEDAGAPVLLTEGRFREALPETSAAVLCLDGSWDEIAGEERWPPHSGAGPENLAYVVYTSGSTGRPKGVEIPHAGLMNLVRWHQDLYGVTAEDHGTQIASPAFDASIWELWPYLAAGAGVHVPDEETRLSPPGMVRWWSEKGITVAYLMTPLAEGVLEEEIPAALPLRVRALLIGGDRLHRGPSPGVGFRLMNHYGPAEYSVTSTVVAVPEQGEGAVIPSIGRPVDNTRIYVLDRQGQPVPAGVPGELYVAGLGLARGYMHRPGLTAEKFVPDPFAPLWEETGGRMYRTADLVRWRPDGELDFLGRLDHQVKIRGLRIELGEIESVLGQHPGLREVAVLVREDRPRDKRLTAYVVPAGEPHAHPVPPAVAELQRFLLDRLPEYMVPTVFVYLDTLPLTPNGKVDRRALPVPQWEPERKLVAPRTPAEEILAVIWSKVLRVERIGVQDNFFDLGGHSLLASQVVSRIREAFGVELPLRSFFAALTVESLARMLETQGEDAALAAPPLTARARRGGGEPLSFSQQRLWFLHQLDRESTAYHIPVALRLEGSLKPAALAAALKEVVRRHESLRTTFEMRAEGPVQVIAPPACRELPMVDLSGLEAARRETEMRLRALEEAALPFDLTRGPLLRTYLVCMGDREHLLLLVMHHIVSDAWSMAVLWRETVELYRSVLEGRPAELPVLPIQYSDFALWQQEWLSGEVLAAQLSYWHRQLAGAPTLLELPTDRPRPRVQRFRGGRQGFALPAEATRRLKELGQREGATLFMTVLAAFDTLLHRYSRQDDVVVGFPIAGRNRIETEGLIGFFVNTLALRAAVSGESSWRELLRQVREVSLGGYAHQEVPFEKLVAELGVERNLAHAPLFQTLLVMQNTPALTVEVPGLTVSPLELGTGTAKFDLVLNLGETAGGLAGRWLYNNELFEAPTVARMAGHFAALLEAVLADPGRRIEDLPLLGAAERQQLVVSWNDTAAGALPGGSFQELFEAVVERLPASLAVAEGPCEVSYGELNARANRLAHSLLAAGMGREELVAVLAERGVDLLAAMLAIFKAGGVYLPLDPHHPAQRLLQTIEQSGSRIVLASGALRGTADLLATDSREILVLDELLREERPAENPSRRSAPAQLAYVLFTSGSTGAPKGVMIPHEGMINHLSAKISDLGLTAGDRVAQTALQTFDISIWQFLAALLAGGSVHVFSDEVVHDPVRLLDEIEGRGITVFEAVPSLLNALLQVDARFRPALARLRWLIPTGEALPPELCRQWFEAYPEIPLVNAYGPTECTDNVTHQVLRRALAEGAVRTPIGRPLRNTRLYALEPGGEPAPIGVPGELAVGGIQVGRGYWGRPDLSAERFVPDPFGPAGSRLYRTGDLARRRAGGEIEFLGRIDHQVKVRGFRIELGEIEAALLSHPSVGRAVVLARPRFHREGGREGELDKRLVAYVVAEGGEETSLVDLRDFLRERLPDYMVPASFVQLAQIPLMPNGKVDRKALPVPEESAAGPQGFLAPRSELEQLLCALWAEALGLDPLQVSVQASFFDLGGDSIRGAILINRLQRKLGQIIHVVALFNHPTVADMAGYLMRDHPEAVAGLGMPEVTRQSPLHASISKALVPLQAGGSRRPLFLVHPVGGEVSWYLALARRLGTDRPVYGLELTARAAAEDFDLPTLAERHLAAVRSVQKAPPYHLGGWSLGAVVAFEMARQLRETGEEVGLLAMIDPPAPLASPHGDDETALLRILVRELEGSSGRSLGIVAEELAGIAPEAGLRRLLVLAQAAGALPANLGLDDMEHELRERLIVFRQNRNALRTYLPASYPGRLTLFRAIESLAGAGDPTFGWRSLAAGGADVHLLPGDHYSILRMPAVDELAGPLLRELGREAAGPAGEPA